MPGTRRDKNNKITGTDALCRAFSIYRDSAAPYQGVLWFSPTIRQRPWASPLAADSLLIRRSPRTRLPSSRARRSAPPLRFNAIPLLASADADNNTVLPRACGSVSQQCRLGARQRPARDSLRIGKRIPLLPIKRPCSNARRCTATKGVLEGRPESRAGRQRAPSRLFTHQRRKTATPLTLDKKKAKVICSSQ